MPYTPSWIKEPDVPADADVTLIIDSVAIVQTATNAERTRMAWSVALIRI
jgi:hypothetical protein